MIENLRNLLLDPLRKGAVLLSLLLCSGSILAQTLVTGTVTDVSGETLPGVSILIEGTTQGTVTDANGKFSLEVPNSASRLSVSYVGFISQLVNVDDSPLSIVMDVDVQSLEEVVVVGYGTMKKSDLTGSVGQLSADELNSQPITTMEQGLQGRIAGVKITTSSGAPGGGMSVQIRGVTSILNGSEPLYVIDGFPVS
ncbi:MAG: carboxypeptidase-like regulatory domain-containing protein, partial [Cyclobacteriaceae bacterium]